MTPDYVSHALVIDLERYQSGEDVTARSDIMNNHKISAVGRYRAEKIPLLWMSSPF